jgi:hypothetical protein
MSTTSTRRSTRLAVVSAVLALAGLLAGCATNNAASTTSTSTSTTLEITATTVHYVPQYVSIAGHTILMPTEEHHEPIQAYSNFGQNVIITNVGFEPSKLYAAGTSPVVFWNLTDTTQEVVFYHVPGTANSGPIAPGGHYSFHYKYASALVYGNKSGSDVAHLYIGMCPPACG